MRRSSVRLCQLLALSVACLQARAVAQAPQSSEGAVAAESQEYKQTIDAALEEYNLQHFDEARSLFERAHAIDPNARTLRGLGMVEFERRQYVRAESLLEESLASSKKPLTDAQRASVQELLARTRQFITQFVLTWQPPAAQPDVELDGQAITLDSAQRFATISGSHTLRVSAPGFVTRELALDARGGDQQTLNVLLTAQEGAKNAKKAAKPARSRSTAGIVLTSAGGAGLVASGVLGGLALSAASAAHARDDADADRARGLSIGADVALGVGIAAAVSGVVLLWRHAKQHSKGAEPARVDALGPRLRVSF